MSQSGPSKMTLIKKWPKFKNNLKSRSDGTAWAPKARRPTFGPLCIRPTILPFLCSCPFLVSMFAVGLCVLWVLCGPSKATVRCYTSICDGIFYLSHVLRAPCFPGDTCISQCYDKDLDPQGAKYKGCVNTTVTGRSCQVKKHFWGFSKLNTLPGLGLQDPSQSWPYFTWGESLSQSGRTYQTMVVILNQ